VGLALDRAHHAGSVTSRPVIAREWEQLVALDGFLSLGYLGIFIASEVLYLCWLYRAYANLGPLGAAEIRMTPGWAVGWHFIPIANLWKPLHAMTDLYRGSVGRSGPVGLWWALVLLAGASAQVSAKGNLQGPGLTELMMFQYVHIVSALLALAVTALNIVLIFRIDRAQVARAAEITSPTTEAEHA
jgi:hypothetical protein